MAGYKMNDELSTTQPIVAEKAKGLLRLPEQDESQPTLREVMGHIRSGRRSATKTEHDVDHIVDTEADADTVLYNEHPHIKPLLGSLFRNLWPYVILAPLLWLIWWIVRMAVALIDDKTNWIERFIVNNKLPVTTTVPHYHLHPPSTFFGFLWLILVIVALVQTFYLWWPWYRTRLTITPQMIIYRRVARQTVKKRGDKTKQGLTFKTESTEVPVNMIDGIVPSTGTFDTFPFVGRADVTIMLLAEDDIYIPNVRRRKRLRQTVNQVKPYERRKDEM